MQELELLLVLVSYSFSILLSARGRAAFRTRGAKPKDARAIVFRYNEITNSINAALVSEELKANASFPVLIRTQLHALREAVQSHLTVLEVAGVEKLVIDSSAEWAQLASAPTYARMKPIVRKYVEELRRQRFTEQVIYGAFVEHAATLWVAQHPTAAETHELLREIRFAPEHQQAGIAILSYFAVVLRQKLPDVGATVSIRQERDRVVLIIAYPDGSEEEVTQTLAEYGMVVRGQLPAENFFNEPFQAIALRQKLELANMELRLVKELVAAERATGESRFKSLESEVAYLRQQLATQLELGGSVNRRLLDMLRRATESGPGTVRLEPLLLKLVDAIVRRDETMLKLQIEEIGRESPGMLERLTRFISSNTIGGVLGNAAYDWLKIVWPILPK